MATQKSELMPGRLQAPEKPHLGPERSVVAVGKDGCDSGVQACKVACTAHHLSVRPETGAGAAVHDARVSRGLFLYSIMVADTFNIPIALHDM